MNRLNFGLFGLLLAACSSTPKSDLTPGTGTSAASGLAGTRARASGEVSAGRAGGSAGIPSAAQGTSAQAGTGGRAGRPAIASVTAGQGGAAGRAAVRVPLDSDAGVGDGTALQGSGSCRAAHDSPGCSNADLQVCVCELRPACCTQAWTVECSDIVMQKRCQPGVRECVCGSGDEQWRQTDCCDKRWTDTCESVAENKCAAQRGCF